jgi:hypothetical protein
MGKIQVNDPIRPRELDTLLDLILKGGAAERINAKDGFSPRRARRSWSAS